MINLVVAIRLRHGLSAWNLTQEPGKEGFLQGQPSQYSTIHLCLMALSSSHLCGSCHIHSEQPSAMPSHFLHIHHCVFFQIVGLPVSTQILSPKAQKTVLTLLNTEARPLLDFLLQNPENFMVGTTLHRSLASLCAWTDHISTGPEDRLLIVMLKSMEISLVSACSCVPSLSVDRRHRHGPLCMQDQYMYLY